LTLSLPTKLHWCFWPMRLTKSHSKNLDKHDLWTNLSIFIKHLREGKTHLISFAFLIVFIQL
jgi:hypothetical protein